ncbi:MAG: long-chain fatty acid--CoA ligase [Gammaproteobacteria bacterium]|nr:long-chain fatty acid--CoA ligase [Gammaproteobacteria bacterium]
MTAAISAAGASHIVSLFRQLALLHGERPAYEWQLQECWQQASWGEMMALVERAASALIRAGHCETDRVGVMARNMPEWTIADLAILAARGVPVPIYPTSTLEQTRYIVADAGVQILLVGEEAQLAVASVLLAEGLIRQIVVFEQQDVSGDDPRICSWASFVAAAPDQPALADRASRFSRDDLFTLIYTSGTTGEPKGVMLGMDNLLAALALHDQRVMVDERDRSLCMLPLSHILERCWSYYVLYRGATNLYIRDPQQAVSVMPQLKPTLMCAVPRVFEKAMGTVQAKVAAARPLQQRLFGWAMAVGARQAELRNRGEGGGWYQRLCYALADALVLSKVRERFGGRIRYMPTAGARLDDKVNGFFQALGLHLKYGYGLTETCATVSCYPDQGYVMGSIGLPLPEIEVRLGPDNEIQVRGATIMRGYYHKPEATAEAFTADGWLRTGDAGAIDAAGNLYFTERLKELMKTSNGKYVAPQRVEGVLAQEPLIEQVAVFADARHFVSALIVPRLETLEVLARQLGLQAQSAAELLAHPAVVKLVEQRLKAAQQELANWEQVRRFTLLAAPFSLENGELTPTLKLRRKVIASRYAHEIEAMYVE